MTALPDDRTLTEAGLPAPDRPRGRVLVVACGALAREILALVRLNGWDHIDLQCLPAILHNRPERIPDAVEAAVVAARGRYAAVFVAYADCGTGGLLAARCRALGVEMIAGRTATPSSTAPSLRGARRRRDAGVLSH
jgi:hypothetical protein